MKRLLVLAVLVASACAPPAPRSDAHWRQVSEQAEPLEKARPACRAYAMERSSLITGQGLAAKAAAGAFAECMRERGWALDDQP